MKPSVISLCLAAAANALLETRHPRDLSGGQAKNTLSRRTNSTGNGSTCPAPKTERTKAAKANPFQALSQDEVDSVLRWVSDPAQGLNLTSLTAQNLSQTDNYVWHVEVLKPNKTDVLAYLDGGASSVPRHARVVINEGGRDVPRVAEYYVGPLPVDNTTTKIQPLDFIYNGANGASILFNGRFFDTPRRKAVDPFVAKFMTEIADITNDLVGFAYYGGSDNRTTAETFYGNPSSTDGTTGVLWLPFRRKGLASYDKPSNLYVSIDISGTDPSLYKMRMIVYDLVIYKSVEEFREAWTAGKIKKTPAPPADESFLRKDRIGDKRKLEDRMAPTIVEPEGKRYAVDTENRYVEYLGWSFYTRFDRDVGVQFYDIKFKGERIMYELSLQDAIAQYAGNNPFQAGTAYMDRFYGIGAQVGRLIPGYDCPYHATYWNSEFTSGTAATKTNNSICIFETDIGTPITRHTDPGVYMQSTKGSKLVIRQIATVGNYDYLFDYTFWVDGTIGVDAHASGYVQANYYRPEDEGKWGPRIHDTITGTLHTHVMNFKADFDLGGAANTLVRTDIVVENITQPWYPERGEFEMMRYNISEVASEKQALLPLPANGQSMYTIVNKDKKNKWGEDRGYRIVPGLSNIHLASMRSPFFLKSAQFAKQFLGVSRQKDTEPDSSAALNQNVPAAPLVEFWRFFEDDESLVQQDLVAWVNLGMHHYTRSEDMPNTLMSEAHSSITFAPQNWGDTELTTDLSNAIIYNGKAGVDRIVPETNGVSVPDCFPLSAQDELLGVFENTGIVPHLIGKVSLFIPELPGYGISSPPSSHTKLDVGRALLESLCAAFAVDKASSRGVILGGHDRGARVAHRLAVSRDALFPADGGLTLLGAVLLDIVPTKVQWEAFADPAVSRGYFHWPLLANVALAVPVLQAYGGARWCRGSHALIAGSNEAGRARIAADGAIDVHAGFFESEDVLRATCEDYAAGSNEDVIEQVQDQKAGRKITVPTLVMFSAEKLGARLDVAEIWKDWIAEGVDYTPVAVGDGYGHYLPEEASDVVTQKINEFLEKF
ncbi:hypothetical protein PspLS_03075 [Pyricularia sp. CBS 133598]|nr:hypothetical protein PspLS_03075 [Pyricularia sp. CBS 133598]